MPLPLSADSLDAIPEAVRGAYVERGGKFVLDAEIEDVSGLKAKNADLIKREKQARERAAILGERTAEEVQADLEFAAKMREQKAKDEGNFETLKAQLLQQHATEKDKLTGRTKKVEGKLYDVLAKREAEAAITAAGGNPKVLLPHILPFIKVTEADDDFAAQVVDSKGNARIADAQGSLMTIAQLVETFKADEAFGVAFAASGASGSGARNDGGQRVGAGVMVISSADAKDVQKYRQMKAEATKRGVALQIAG